MFFKTVDFISRCFFKILILIDAIVFHTYICYDNGKKLFTLLIRGTRTWVIMLFRLVMFTLMLAPGWFKLLRYWFLSPLIIRNLRYGKGAKNRNLLDVYLPVPQKRSKHKDSAGSDINYNNSCSRKNGAPVVVFVSGGAWTIGYKLWSALVARGLAKLGILTIVPDYRNFPQGDVEDMMEDIRLAVEWTSINAHRFGGDANKIVLSGQSAGAHITLCLLVSDYLEKKLIEQDNKNKSREATQSHAERYLANTDDSGSVFEEDNSDEDYSDYESEISGDELQPEEVGTPIPGVPVSNMDEATEDQNTDVGLVADPVALDGEAEISPLTVEYMTPLRTNSHTHVTLPKSPRGSLHAGGSTEEIRHSSSRKSRRAGSLRYVHSGTVDDGEDITLHKHHSSGSRKKRSYSSDHIQPQTRPASGSIIDMIDTYLGANISSNNHKSTSSKIISNTASSLKKKFREQVRRNSDAMSYEPDRFFPSEETSSSSEERGPDGEGAWREVESVRKSARRNSPRTMAFLNRSQGTPHNASHAPFSPLTRFPSALEEADPAVKRLEALESPAAIAPPLAVVQQRILSKDGMKRTRKTKKKFCVASNVKLFIGVSGPYNLEALESHLHQRGMDSRILNWICRGSIGNYSPTTQLAEFAKQHLAQQHKELNATHSGEEVAPQVYSVSQPSAALADLTPIALFHGSRDATIPVSICTDLSNVLHTHGANALCKIYEGWSHTDAILEAPLSGTMRLFHDMAGVIFAHTAECSSIMGSADNVAGLSGAADRLVIPPNPNAQEPDDYICSPLDYLSLTLFPKLFGTAAGTTAERVPVPGSANTSISGDETRKHAPPGSPGADSQLSRTSQLTDKARRKQQERERKRKAAQIASNSDPMVSQLLVKMAREINPF